MKDQVMAVLFLGSLAVLPGYGQEGLVIERGPHHKIIQLESGQRVTALADGMHYDNGGQWAESREEIELFQDGALARRGQHKVTLHRT